MWKSWVCYWLYVTLGKLPILSMPQFSYYIMVIKILPVSSKSKLNNICKIHRTCDRVKYSKEASHFLNLAYLLTKMMPAIHFHPSLSRLQHWWTVTHLYPLNALYCAFTIFWALNIQNHQSLFLIFSALIGKSRKPRSIPSKLNR